VISERRPGTARSPSTLPSPTAWPASFANTAESHGEQPHHIEVMKETTTKPSEPEYDSRDTRRRLQVNCNFAARRGRCGTSSGTGLVAPAMARSTRHCRGLPNGAPTTCRVAQISTATSDPTDLVPRTCKRLRIPLRADRDPSRYCHQQRRDHQPITLPARLSGVYVSLRRHCYGRVITEQSLRRRRCRKVPSPHLMQPDDAHHQPSIPGHTLCRRRLERNDMDPNIDHDALVTRPHTSSTGCHAMRGCIRVRHDLRLTYRGQATLRGRTS
jgi:hypothetical protein